MLRKPRTTLQRQRQNPYCSIKARLLGVAVLYLSQVFSAAASGVQPGQSIARQWNELTLLAIRNDLARPTVHARNLWHLSIAMWDGWAAYNATAVGFLVDEKLTSDNKARDRAVTISYAAFRILNARFADSPGADASLEAFNDHMASLGLDPNFVETETDSPAALGNRIAAAILHYGLTDGSNEQNDYANQVYLPVNEALTPALPGNPNLTNPDRWQPLGLEFFIDQAGNVLIDGVPDFLSPEWGQVTPFALRPTDSVVNSRDDNEFRVYLDPGAPPGFAGAGADDYRWGFELVSIWSSHLDPDDGVMWDASPASIGNAPLPLVADERRYYELIQGGDWSVGHPLNPVTGQPYTPNPVLRGDYTRVLAEFWADGPDSETPPGHWFVIANYVADHPQQINRLAGEGPVVDRLEWDVKLYFTLGGAMHDAAIAAWSVKGWYDYIRPVSAIRYLAGLGQRSDPSALSFHPDGINLVPGFIELITSETTAPGARHANLPGNEGKIALYTWRGPGYVFDPSTQFSGVGWILADDWWPYQRPTFVTPPFAGYVSGHSTFSRAGAEILTRITGSAWFPGGLGEFFCPQNEFLVFEEGPSQNVTLQWATYYDASDQTSLSRIWGGIHPPADDIAGRQMGSVVGQRAFEFANTFFGQTEDNPNIFSSGFEQDSLRLQ